MSKGTPSMGKKNKKVHSACRRCGRHAYHLTDKICAACGYGQGSRMRAYSWANKLIEGGRRF